MRILLDTNMLLRALEPGNAHHQTSLDAIDVLRQRGHEMVIVPQVLYEFWTVATRPIEHNGFALAFAPDGQSLATGSSDTLIRLWDLGTNSRRFTCYGHTAAVDSLAFFPNGNTLASGSCDGTVRLWSLS